MLLNVGSGGGGAAAAPSGGAAAGGDAVDAPAEKAEEKEEGKQGYSLNPLRKGSDVVFCSQGRIGRRYGFRPVRLISTFSRRGGVWFGSQASATYLAADRLGIETKNKFLIIWKPLREF